MRLCAHILHSHLRASTCACATFRECQESCNLQVWVSVATPTTSLRKMHFTESTASQLSIKRPQQKWKKRDRKEKENRENKTKECLRIIQALTCFSLPDLMDCTKIQLQCEEIQYEAGGNGFPTLQMGKKKNVLFPKRIYANREASGISYKSARSTHSVWWCPEEQWIGK